MLSGLSGSTILSSFKKTARLLPLRTILQTGQTFPVPMLAPTDLHKETCRLEQLLALPRRLAMYIHALLHDLIIPVTNPCHGNHPRFCQDKSNRKGKTWEKSGFPSHISRLSKAIRLDLYRPIKVANQSTNNLFLLWFEAVCYLLPDKILIAKINEISIAIRNL